MDKREFINSVKEGALKGYSEFGILPSLTIAQAILESGWGSSGLSQKANNLFGIKAFSSWTGKKITMETAEWYGDKKQIIKAEFRAYDSFNYSIEDHNKLLSNSRYKPLGECMDYKAACQKIYECGYATDPKYTEKLIRIIEDNRLYEFDEAKADDKVRRFQKLCNDLNIKDSEGKALAEDNILGSKTRSCIANLPVLKSGSRGQAVKFVQPIVGAAPVDGDFGAVTKQCVIEYQKNNNIEADGIVGPQTWLSMLTT
jgi:peptidoglycan hydrolase-like protein with peptidoglycan-binding domain